MSFLLKDIIHTSLAEIVYNDILAGRSNYYYYIGKIIDWSDPNNPDIALETGQSEYITRNDIISVKKILPQDVSFVIPRINWESGEIYDQYDPDYSIDFPSSTGATTLKTSKFYVLVSYQGTYYNVYKCLFNNGGAESTEQPTGSDPVAISYSDGYIWKYMYTIPLNLRNKFLTKDYIPVAKAVQFPYYANGEISSVVIDSMGSGYTSNTLLSVSVDCQFLGGSGNVSANIRPILNESGKFVDVLITDSGNNIKSANITITDYSSHGESYYKNANSAIIVNSGAGYTTAVIANTTAIITSTGAQPNSNAIVSLSFSNSSLTGVNIVNGGSGYTTAIASNTTISISTSGASQPGTNAAVALKFENKAKLKPIIYEGKLVDVVIQDPGLHYTNNSRTTVSLIGDGANAKLIPYINEVGQLEDIIIEDRGHGYTYLDIDIVGDGVGANAYASFYTGDLNSIQSTVELSAISGAIHNVKIVDPGDSFTTANVTVTGDGTGFTGNVIITNNVISKINIINPGRNYTYANVTIEGDGGNAIVQAILSPQGGHGFNPVKELFADTLIIYSTVNNEKNQGLFVNNDYRQFGLIRNIKDFEDNETFESFLGSTCYLANLTSKVNLTRDDILVLTTDHTKEFDVITIDENTNKVLLNSKNNHLLEQSDILINLNTDQIYNITNIVAEPNINKFSGDLLFIDNRTTISYSDNQLVTLKTVLKL